MKSHEFIRQLREQVNGRTDLIMERLPLYYGKNRFEFIRITSANCLSFRLKKWLLITAGFHGNEKAGPLTILSKLAEIVEYAHSRNIGLVIYPLINPSGFDTDQRYGLGGRGESGNNDFLRYTLFDGRVVDDLGDKRENVCFRSWQPIDSCRDSRPNETVWLNRCIDEDIKYCRFAGAIDLHQDRFLSGPAAYHYALGENLPRYSEIVEKVEAIVGYIFRNLEVDSGESSPAMSDDLGCVERHDGSITDYLYRCGVPHTIVVETTGDTPMGIAIEANMIWIRGIIELIAQKHEGT
jgi:hypothetical protein